MAKITKILHFFFNLVLWLCAWVITGIGIWLIVDPKLYEPSRYIDTHNIVTAAYIILSQLIAELQQYPYDDRARGFIDSFQVKLSCCGVVSLNDYQRYGMSIPSSCYLTGTQFLNQKGCALALREFLELRSGIIGLLCSIAALIQLILIALTLMLFCAKKRNFHQKVPFD
ncbi:unnamed protein product, partial [Medioppia subpectinata]